MNLEEFFLKEDFIKADDKYISNGACAIRKDYIKSKALKIAKNTDDLFAECKETVPFERGIDFDCTSIGTKCMLGAKETLEIYYNEMYGFDYKYVKMLIKQLPYWEIPAFYVVENKNGEPILKIFNEQDEFIACLIAIKHKKAR